jgi:fatty acid-binding protein DegV
MAIRITSDSTCDLSPEIKKQLDIKILPLYLTLDGHAYRDGHRDHSEDIFRHVNSGGDMYSTAAINIADLYRFFQFAA